MRALQRLNRSLPVGETRDAFDSYTVNRGGWSADQAESFLGADPMSIATVYRCVGLNASGLAGCPVKAYDVTSRADVRIPSLQTVDAAWSTAQELHETVMLHLQLWGNAFLRLWRNADGVVVQMVPVHPSDVEVIYNADFRDGKPLVKQFKIRGGSKKYSTAEVLHIPALSMDGVLGLSVIGKLRRTFGAAVNYDKSAERLAGQGMRIAGILTTDQRLNPDQADQVKVRWAERTAGPNAAGSVPVLSGGIQFQPVDMNPADAKFLEMRRYQVTELARLFGIPGWMVNDQEKDTAWGTGMEQQFTTWVTLTLKPFAQRIEQRYRRSLLPFPESQKCEFVLEGLLRGDSAARAAYYSSGITNGWLTPNEVRDREDLTPVEWGNEPYLPHNTPAPTGGDA